MTVGVSKQPSKGNAGKISVGLKDKKPAKNPNATFPVTFGSVTVVVRNPSLSEIKRNIKAGQTALARAQPAFAKKGVTLPSPKTVPIYYADSSVSGQIVRDVGGKVTKGKVVNGVFRALAKSGSQTKTKPKPKAAKE